MSALQNSPPTRTIRSKLATAKQLDRSITSAASIPRITVPMSSSNAQPGAQPTGQPHVTSPTLTSTTHDRIVFKQDEIIVLNKLKVSPNEVASLTRKELNALYHNMRNNLTNTTVEPVAHPANNSTCTPTPSETKQTCPSSPTSVRQSIAATQELITETLTSSKKMLASTDKILSASNELEKKWKEFQESFQKMTNAMVDNIAASLGNAPDSQLNQLFGGGGGGGGGFQTYAHVPVSIPQVVDYISKATKIVVLTGAGVSVSSGIPTYRGSDGTWTMGSEHYKPQEIATWLMYSTKMKECWEYFTERYDMCRKAEPNVSHSTLVELEHYCVAQNKEFTLVSQNIDNLHRRAGSTNPLESKCNGEQCPPIFLVQHI